MEACLVSSAVRESGAGREDSLWRVPVAGAPDVRAVSWGRNIGPPLDAHPIQGRGPGVRVDRLSSAWAWCVEGQEADGSVCGPYLDCGSRLRGLPRPLGWADVAGGFYHSFACAGPARGGVRRECYATSGSLRSVAVAEIRGMVRLRWMKDMTA